MKTLTVLIIVLCLGGVLAATLAYGEHYNTQPSPCRINDIWDCGIVNHSPYAVMHGVPVALFGVLGYGLLLALAGRFPWLTFAGATGGLLFSLRFTWIEWHVLQVWCLYCVSSQILIALVFLLALTQALRSRPDWKKF